MSDGASFGTVAIVGVGLLGGSIGKALRRNQSAARIIGVGRSTERLELAMSLGAITEIATSLEEAATQSDIIILCTPVGQIIADLPTVLLSAAPNAVVTDVGSVKQAICAVAADDSRFVGGHPMAGSEQGGVVPSRPDLFQEATWAITPVNTTSPAAVRIVKELAQSLGAATMILSPNRHDYAVAITSHLPHAIATSMMRLAKEKSASVPEVQKLTAGSFADATRVAASSAELWTDIFECNEEALADVLIGFRQEIDGFIEDLKNGDRSKLYDRFESGSDAKQLWREQK